MASTRKAATTKTAAKKAATKPTKPAPVVDDELDEVEDDAPATGREEVTFGASDLARHLSEGRKKPVTAREIRTLLRKMARDGSGRVNREIIAGNRSRYNWSGVDDPEVQAVIKAFNDGELEADKQEKLQALKERKAAQKAAGEKSGKKSKKATKKAEPVVEEDDDEELELDDEDE